MGDANGLLLHFLYHPLRKQRHDSSLPGTVSRVRDPLRGHLRKQAHRQSALYVDIAPKGSRKINVFQVFPPYSLSVKKNLYSRPDRSLCQLKLPDISRSQKDRVLRVRE